MQIDCILELVLFCNVIVVVNSVCIVIICKNVFPNTVFSHSSSKSLNIFKPHVVILLVTWFLEMILSGFVGMYVKHIFLCLKNQTKYQYYKYNLLPQVYTYIAIWYWWCWVGGSDGAKKQRKRVVSHIQLTRN